MRFCYFLFLFSLLACDQEKVLTENQWVLISGRYKGKPLHFQSTDFIQFRSTSGYPFFNFSKDGEIILPGISTRNIPGKWSAANDQITIWLDSSQLDFTNFDGVELGADTTLHYQSPDLDYLNSAEFRQAMNVYSSTFTYSIVLDTLYLTSATAQLKAVRDRTIDDLMKTIDPNSLP